MKSVYSAVRTGFLNKAVFHSSLKGQLGHGSPRLVCTSAAITFPPNPILCVFAVRRGERICLRKNCWNLFCAFGGARDWMPFFWQTAVPWIPVTRRGSKFCNSYNGAQFIELRGRGYLHNCLRASIQWEFQSEPFLRHYDAQLVINFCVFKICFMVQIFCTRPDRPWGPPSLLYNGYRVFPGG
jgi:hypothetical protein